MQETLLNYVEAINELKEPYTMEMPNGSQVTVEHNTADIVKYFNLIVIVPVCRNY